VPGLSGPFRRRSRRTSTPDDPGDGPQHGLAYGGQADPLAVPTSDLLTERPAAVEMVERAAALSHDPEAVAITVWSAGHNPLGRAKVLHDVLVGRRPVMIFGYLFDEFGGSLWPPLMDSDADILAIPWKRRGLYHALFQELGVRFDTVWLCKPRLPTFVLAAQVSAPGARLVLDLDDNEEQFALSPGARRKVFGLAGMGRTRSLLQDIPARTVVSRTLQREYGGSLLRHVRAEVPTPARPDAARTGPARVGFIGTVRPHKNLVSAAKAVRKLAASTGRPVELHVIGDVNPPGLREELTELGAIVDGIVPMSRLPQVLGQLDCVLCGFPSDRVEDRAISEYQISSKIGDALSVGRPVLVPEGPSVSDLVDLPGVYLFDKDSFGDKLLEALDTPVPPSLPRELSVEAAAETFESVVATAAQAPKAAEVFGPLAQADRADTPMQVHDGHLLIIAGGHGSGRDGRRPDQIARAHRRGFPELGVTILELLHKDDKRGYARQGGDHTSDAQAVLADAQRKASEGQIDRDGVARRLVEYHDRGRLGSLVEDLLLRRGLLPGTTQLLVCPPVRDLEVLRPLLAAYDTVVDLSNDPDAATHMQEWAGSRAIVHRSPDLLADEPPVGTRWVSAPDVFLFPDAPVWRGSRPEGRPLVLCARPLRESWEWETVMRLAEEIRGATVLVHGPVPDIPAADHALAHVDVSHLGPLGENGMLALAPSVSVAWSPPEQSHADPVNELLLAACGVPLVIMGRDGADDVPGEVRATLEGRRPPTAPEGSAPTYEAYISLLTEMTPRKPRL
jgi:glycosyltransferase involved in cell wall biosynthesis